ncbi:mating-type protein MAT alpha 1, partial [Bimuria novae-zelandiae CBS 107.79]
MAIFSQPCLEGDTQPPNPLEIQNHLATRTGAQMVQLMQSMQDPYAQAALATALLVAPPAASGCASVLRKVKKPLNAFVGFRCYYIKIPDFKNKGWQMKELSQPIGTIWESDPNKSKWSLMTKAWSTIRDQIGKNRAPLDEFFGYACPFLNIPSPEQYLNQFGWTLQTDQLNLPKLVRRPGASTQVGAVDEAHSVEDVIRHCQSMGYAQGFILAPNSTSSTFLGHS